MRSRVLHDWCTPPFQACNTEKLERALQGQGESISRCPLKKEKDVLPTSQEVATSLQLGLVGSSAWPIQSCWSRRSQHPKSNFLFIGNIHVVRLVHPSTILNPCARCLLHVSRSQLLRGQLSHSLNPPPPFHLRTPRPTPAGHV